MRGVFCLLASLLVSSCGCNEGITGHPDASDTGGETDGDLIDDIDCEDCDDADPCTEDSCDPLTGECLNVPLDADRDGFAAMVAPDGTTCGGDDCDDTDDTVYPGAPEVCLDGVDQDCDTLVDGPMAMLSTVHLKTVSTGASPSIAWTGSEFAVAWFDIHDIYLGRVGLDGELVEDPIQITDLRWSLCPRIAWTGSELGVVFYNNFDHDGCGMYEVDCFSDIHFMRVSPTAALIGDIITLNDVDTVGLTPRVVWTGSEFGVFWNDGRDGPCPTFMECENEVYFSRAFVIG
jgi:hypothetical protein